MEGGGKRRKTRKSEEREDGWVSVLPTRGVCNVTCFYFPVFPSLCDLLDRVTTLQGRVQGLTRVQCGGKGSREGGKGGKKGRKTDRWGDGPVCVCGNEAHDFVIIIFIVLARKKKENEGKKELGEEGK